jgi:hypothetical protein
MSNQKNNLFNPLGQFEKGEIKYFPPEISLRDYFAAAAMNRILSATLFTSAELPRDPDQTRMELAKACYKLADAMIEARKGGA